MVCKRPEGFRVVMQLDQNPLRETQTAAQIGGIIDVIGKLDTQIVIDGWSSNENLLC